MKTMKKYDAYTLREVLTSFKSGVSTLPRYVQFGQTFSANVTTFLPHYADQAVQGMLPFITVSNNTYQLTTSAIQLFNYLFLRYAEEYCCVVFEDETFAQKASYVMDEIMAITAVTYDKYNDLFTFYTAQRANLLNAIETGATRDTTHKYKDTPQTTIDPSSDGYNTTVNYTHESVTGTDQRDTLIARLDEIDKKYKNLMLDWTNEFERLFINIYNLEE